MPWIIVTAPFDHRTSARSLDAHSPHPHPRKVTAECAKLALAKHAARKVRTPTKAEAALLAAGQFVDLESTPDTQTGA